jgi:hypothetical protein
MMAVKSPRKAIVREFSDSLLIFARLGSAQNDFSGKMIDNRTANQLKKSPLSDVFSLLANKGGQKGVLVMQNQPVSPSARQPVSPSARQPVSPSAILNAWRLGFKRSFCRGRHVGGEIVGRSLPDG